MQAGMDPMTALQRSMAPVIKFYPSFRGAMIAVNMEGKYGMFKEITNTDFDFLYNQPILFSMSVF